MTSVDEARPRLRLVRQRDPDHVDRATGHVEPVESWGSGDLPRSLLELLAEIEAGPEPQGPVPTPAPSNSPGQGIVAMAGWARGLLRRLDADRGAGRDLVWPHVVATFALTLCDAEPGTGPLESPAEAAWSARVDAAVDGFEVLAPTDLNVWMQAHADAARPHLFEALLVAAWETLQAAGYIPTPSRKRPGNSRCQRTRPAGSRTSTRAATMAERRRRRRALLEYTAPDVLTTGVRAGWAEPETDPTRIDWPRRQAMALIPFTVLDGRPVSPGPPATVQRGRNGFGRWGENPMADAVVTATPAGGRRHVLLVKRADGHGWAVPGGSIDPGETPLAASARELREETGLAVAAGLWSPGVPQYVPDPRGSDEAWAVTVANRADLGPVPQLPDVQGADDVVDAAWIPADSYDQLLTELAQRHDGRVFTAHVDLLRAALPAHPDPAPTTAGEPGEHPSHANDQGAPGAPSGLSTTHTIPSPTSIEAAEAAAAGGCWVIRPSGSQASDPPEDVEHDPHFPSQQEAAAEAFQIMRDAADDDRASQLDAFPAHVPRDVVLDQRISWHDRRVLTAVQLPRPCTSLACNSCGEPLRDPDSEIALHFTLHDEAETFATSIGWTRAGDAWHCIAVECTPPPDQLQDPWPLPGPGQMLLPAFAEAADEPNTEPSTELSAAAGTA